MWRADSLEKTLMLRKIEGKWRSGWQRMRWLDSITNSMDMNLSKFLGIVNRGAWSALIHGVAKNQTRLSNWTTTTAMHILYNDGLAVLCVCVCVCVCVRARARAQFLSGVWLFVTPWIVAHQAPLSTEFSKQEHWRGFPFPSSGDLLEPGIERSSLWRLLHWQADSLPLRT